MTGMKNVSDVYEGQFWLAIMHWNKVWIIISVEEDLLHLLDIWLVLGVFNWCPGQIKYKKRNFELSWGKSNLIVLSDLQLPLNLGLAFYQFRNADLRAWSYASAIWWNTANTALSSSTSTTDTPTHSLSIECVSISSKVFLYIII